MRNATAGDGQRGQTRHVRLTCVKALLDRQAKSKGVTAEARADRATELIAKGLLSAHPDLSVTNSLDTYGARFSSLESAEMRVLREHRAVISASLFVHFEKPGRDPERKAVLDDLRWCAYSVGVPQLTLVKSGGILGKPPGPSFDRTRRSLVVRYPRRDEIPGAIERASDCIGEMLQLTGQKLRDLRSDADATRFNLALFLHRLLSAQLTIAQVSAQTDEWITPMGLWALERHPRMYLRLPHAVLETLCKTTGCPSPDLLRELEYHPAGLTEAERWGLPRELNGVVCWMIELHGFLCASRGPTCLHPRFLSDQDLLTLIQHIRSRGSARAPTPGTLDWHSLLPRLLGRDPTWSGQPA